MHQVTPRDSLVFIFATPIATGLLLIGLISLCYVAVGNAQPFEAVAPFLGSLIGYLLQEKEDLLLQAILD